MNHFTVTPIGKIHSAQDGFWIQLEKEYIPAMKGLEGFGFLQVVWWFDGCDCPKSRTKLTESKPYRHAPDTLGTFATRSPERPNPIALTAAAVTHLDDQNGIIGLAYIDAQDGTPVLDIKPYTPSLDRVEKPIVPQWCAAWPDCVEKSGDFDWSAVFCF